MAQHRVQPTDHPSALRDQLVMAFGEQAQHRAVVLDLDDPQPRMAQRHDRGGAGVVAVGLVAALGGEDPDPSRELGRHIDDVFTSGDELLGQQRTDPGRTFDRPTTRFEPCRERQEPVALLTISADPDLIDHGLGRVEDRCHVRTLVGIDPDDEHLTPPASRMETSRRADLKRGAVPVPSHTETEIRQAVGSFKGQTACGRQGILETTHQTPTTLRTTAAPHPHSHSGHSVRASIDGCEEPCT